jgi:hypothetical protein
LFDEEGVGVGLFLDPRRQRGADAMGQRQLRCEASVVLESATVVGHSDAVVGVADGALSAARHAPRVKSSKG